MIQIPISKKILKTILTGLLGSLGAIVINPKPSLGAEQISFSLPIFGEFNISIDSLEVLAKENIITEDFEFYAKRLDEQTLTQLRQALNYKLEVDPIKVYKLTNSSLGERFLKQIGEAIYTHPERNGMYAIRSALLLAATDSEGLTAINVLRQFPTKEIQINLDLVLSLIEETTNFLAYNESTVEAIAQIAETEISSQPQIDFEQLPDIRQPGTYSVTQKTISVKVNRLRQTTIGFTYSYNLDTDVYVPTGKTESSPLVVITHGFGSSRTHFQYLAEYLASHGYIVLVPEHIGSNKEYQDAFLRGELRVDVSPVEFYSRPQDITSLLDEIANDSEFNNLINWSQVGILGHSFGGNTALAIAGAPINQDRINQICRQNRPSLNISTLLQCRAKGLPSGNYNFRDPRVKAVVATNPVTSIALGVEGMSEIDIPTLMLGGSQDTTTPFIPEQAHPFLWLKTENKYLGVMEGGTHGYILEGEESDGFSNFLKNPSPKLRRSYLKAMGLAFFEFHLRERSDYQPYLSSVYAKHISDEELPLHLVQSLTVEKLEQAYGDTPPTPPIPEPSVAAAPRATKINDVLAQILSTKTLKVAMRSDAAPFGYVDEQANLWTGYCEDFADSLSEYLALSAGSPAPYPQDRSRDGAYKHLGRPQMTAPHDSRRD